MLSQKRRTYKRHTHTSVLTLTHRARFSMPSKCVVCHVAKAHWGIEDDLVRNYCKTCGIEAHGDQIVHIDRHKKQQQQPPPQQHERESYLKQRLGIVITGRTKLPSRGSCVVCKTIMLLEHDRFHVGYFGACLAMHTCVTKTCAYMSSRYMCLHVCLTNMSLCNRQH